jgi:hypothetical protein
LKARLGHQMNSTLNESNCKWASRYGLEAICAKPEIKDPERLYPTVEELSRMLDLGNRHKLKVEIIDSPLLQSTRTLTTSEPNTRCASHSLHSGAIPFPLPVRLAARTKSPRNLGSCEKSASISKIRSYP